MVIAIGYIKKHAGRFRRLVRAGRPFAPLYVKCKVIWGCNLRCAMCNHWRSRSEPPLPTERILTLLDELAQLGCKRIKFSGGEPLLHPDLPELVRHATSRGIFVSLATNGTLMTHDLAKILVQSGLQTVTTSIDAPEASLHDTIRSVDGAFDDTVRGVRELTRPKFHRIVHVNTVVCAENYESLIAMPRLVGNIGASSLKLIAVQEVAGGLKRLGIEQISDYNARIAPRIARRALALGLFKHPREAYIFGPTHEEKPQCMQSGEKETESLYSRIRCFAPFTHAMIEHDGTVKVCCMLRRKAVMGDLKTQSFRQIWECDEYRRLRESERLPIHRRCLSCRDFIETNRKLARLYATDEQPSRIGGLYSRIADFFRQ
ncbi:MAG: radical SAM protein [Candidatus Sumerlaeia bacterium]